MYDATITVYDISGFKFTGKERDQETGLDDFGARFYASGQLPGPPFGRFTSPDSFGGHSNNPQSINRYAYVNDNPLIYTDPTGHYTLSCGTDKHCLKAAKKFEKQRLKDLKSKHKQVRDGRVAQGFSV